MFDKYMIGETGFRNVKEAGKITGFELQVRIAYYRGLGVSMIEGFDVTVDGASFPREKNLFTVGGKAYTFEQLESEYHQRWEMGDFATLTVPCDGGLPLGTHEITVTETLRISYLPFLSVTKATKKVQLEA